MLNRLRLLHSRPVRGRRSLSATADRPPLPQSFRGNDTMKGKKVLIANRGEIAIRIARAARELGAKSLAICAPEDAESPHVGFADDHVVLPKGATAIAPYLDTSNITKVAVENGADFVHPGYGFLSESSIFNKSLSDAGIEWVGPSYQVLDLLGDKIQARALAARSDVPVVRGSGNLTSGEECLEILNDGGVRLPAIMKAAFGGGGRGMRIVRNLSEVASSFDSCQREAAVAFGRDEVFLEEFWEKT